MKKQQPRNAQTKEAAYYDLHTGAVNDLVTANKDNTPRYSQAELEKYRSGKTKWKLPQWLKVGFIKFWFYGAVCYFVFWGLGMYLADQLDLYFVAAVVLGMATDLLINHFLRFTEKLPGGSARWILVTKRGAAGFFMNLAYGFLLLFLIVTAYQMINTAIVALHGSGEGAPLLTVEPLFFGLCALGADALCVSCRNLLRKIIADARKRA